MGNIAKEKYAAQLKLFDMVKRKKKRKTSADSLDYRILLMIYCTKLFVHFHCINPKPQASSVVKTTAMDLVLTAQMTAAFFHISKVGV